MLVVSLFFVILQEIIAGAKTVIKQGKNKKLTLL